MEGLDTLFGVCSGRGDFAIVPLVCFLLLIAADAGTMVILVVELGPIAIGMLGQRGNILGLGSLANGALEGLDTLFGVCSGRGDNTVVPLVCFLLLIAADAGTMVVFIVQLGPVAVGVLGQRGDIFGLGSLANGALEGLDTLCGVRSGRGDFAIIPLVCFGDFLLAVLTDLRVVLTVFFCPTSGGQAVAVVVRIQRELESLRSGLDGAFRVRKQRIALGADVVRFRTLYRTGRGCLCNKGESVVALRSLYGNGAVDDLCCINSRVVFGNRFLCGNCNGSRAVCYNLEYSITEESGVFVGSCICERNDFFSIIAPGGSEK